MGEIVSAAKEAVAEVEPWKIKALAAIGLVGFAAGIGVTVWIKHTLVVQGIYKSMF